MRRWQLKRLLLRPFVSSRIGQDMYEWLTAIFLGTQSGMSRKWCYWFREHVVLCRRHAGFAFQGKRVWLFEPGWSLAPTILSAVVTSCGPLITEQHNRVAARYLPPAIEQVEKHLDGIRRSARAAPESQFWPAIKEAKTAEKVLQLCRAEYRVAGLPALRSIPDGSVDVCMSMGRLEHFTEDELRFIFREMRRILRPNGIGSHIVDHRDHFWHFDKSIHCFHHLTFSDAKWASIAEGKLYRNRLMETDYARLFEAAGFEVLSRTHELHRADATNVDPHTFWGPYANLTVDDLTAAVTHFVVRAA